MAIKKEVKIKKSTSRSNIDQALIENFVNLQKVLTNLTAKFEDLSGNISKLLQLFELSAKSFADKPLKQSDVDSEFLKKLDALLNQNKVISKGIMLMEDKIRTRSNVPREFDPRFRGATRPLR